MQRTFAATALAVIASYSCSSAQAETDWFDKPITSWTGSILPAEGCHADEQTHFVPEIRRTLPHVHVGSDCKPYRLSGSGGASGSGQASGSDSGSGAGSPVRFEVSFGGKVDCDRPLKIDNVPISGRGTGVLNPDGTASADVTQTAFYIFSSTIHFEGRLGSPPTAAPGGTAQIRVAGRNSLRLIWNLPNNQLVVRIDVSGRSCSASFASELRPGQSEHTLYDGNQYHYCNAPRVEQASCQVR
jgi:hypothetical protein